MLSKVPNILSSFRIVLVPLFIAAYFNEPRDVKVSAGVVYAVAGLTDFLDGYIARKYDLTSELGKVLDPLGDKLMQVSALVCITIDGIIPIWAVITAIGKEVLMGLGGLVIHRFKIAIPTSNMLGKVSTVVFIVVCLLLMIFPPLRPRAALPMILGALAVMFAALGGYVMMFLGVVKRGASEKKADTTKL